MMNDLHLKSFNELHVLLNERKISSEELCLHYIERAERLEPCIGAFLYFDRESIIEQARKVDLEISNRGAWSLLAGIPIAIKDNICTKGMPTSCASHALSDFIAPYDATAVERLRLSGAVLFGKTNLDEFGMGSSTENSAFQQTRNPWNLDLVPGGSSGGSAAAASARMIPAALGSDTGGSVRQPASLCGVIGLKPTYGRISRWGLVAFASSLDTIGIISTRTLDNAQLLEIINGEDAYDNTATDLPGDRYSHVALQGVQKIKIGIPRECFDSDNRSEVSAKVFEALHLIEKRGAILRDISIPNAPSAVACYYIICTAEASSNLARYDGVRYGLRVQSDELNAMYRKTRTKGFGNEVKRRIMLGTFVLSSGYYDEYYLKAAKVRQCIADDFQKAFEEVDAIVMPTSPAAAWKFGEKMNDPLEMYLSDIYTVTANLAGLPAVSIPCGFDNSGLPLGMQFMSKHFAESLLYRLSLAYENETEFYRWLPGTS